MKGLVTLLLMLTGPAAWGQVNNNSVLAKAYQTVPLAWTAQAYFGNAGGPGQTGLWLTAEVQVPTGFWANKVVMTIALPDRATACMTLQGDCALTNTADAGLRCVAFCPNPGQLVVSIGPQVICSVAISGPACNNSIPLCNGHCPYTDYTPVVYPLKQGRTWIAPGIYAMESGSSNSLVNLTWPQALADSGGYVPLRLWQCHTLLPSEGETGQYIQSVGLPQTSSLSGVGPPYGLPNNGTSGFPAGAGNACAYPANQESNDHVLGMTFYDDSNGQ